MTSLRHTAARESSGSDTRGLGETYPYPLVEAPEQPQTSASAAKTSCRLLRLAACPRQPRTTRPHPIEQASSIHIARKQVAASYRATSARVKRKPPALRSGRKRNKILWRDHPLSSRGAAKPVCCIQRQRPRREYLMDTYAWFPSAGGPAGAPHVTPTAPRPIASTTHPPRTAATSPCHIPCRFLPLLPPITPNVKLPHHPVRLELGIRGKCDAAQKSKSGKNGNVDRSGQHCLSPSSFLREPSHPPFLRTGSPLSSPSSALSASSAVQFSPLSSVSLRILCGGSRLRAGARASPRI